MIEDEEEVQKDTKSDNLEQSRKERLLKYNSTLKYCQGKSLSLDIIVASKQQTEPVNDHLKTYQSVNENTQELLFGTMLIQSFKKLIKLIQNSVACSQINPNDIKLQEELIDKINGIVHFSKSLMKLYQERTNELDELDIIAKKKAYTCAQNEYCRHLNALKNVITQPEEEDSIALEKAKLQIYKINLMRAIKAVLIGFTSVYHSHLLQEFDQFSYCLKRNLTIDDFVETWDVGLSF